MGFGRTDYMKEKVLSYMKEHGSITTKEAYDYLGCTRLSEYIRQLRLEYNIKDKWENGLNRWGEKTEYKVYWIGE